MKFAFCGLISAIIFFSGMTLCQPFKIGGHFFLHLVTMITNFTDLWNLPLCYSSHALTSDVSLVDTALAAEIFLSDGLIVTGEATGRPADPIKLRGEWR